MEISRGLLFVLVASPCLAQAAWTVDAGGSGQFVDVGAAIAAASPGDRIVVQGAGPYAAFVVDRGVDVEAVAGAGCAAIEVFGVPAGQSARVAGFVVSQANNGSVAVQQCAGEVVLAALGVSALGGPAVAPANPGLLVTASNRVFVRDCTFVGHTGNNVAGAPGILVDGAALAVVGSFATGGGSILQVPLMGPSGEPGLRVDNGGSATITGSTLQGGAAGPGAFIGGRGGDGIAVQTGSAYVLGGCSLLGGPAGAGIVVGAPGYSSRGNVLHTADTIFNGATTTWIGNRPRLLTAPVTPTGGNFVVTVSGVPSQLVFLGIDLGFESLPFAQPIGVLHLTGSTPLFALVTTDVAGQAILTVPIPNTSAARHRNLVVQGATLVGSQLELTAPTIARSQ